MSDPSPALVGPELFISRVRALLRAGGAPRAWPRKQQDRWVLLHSVARRLAEGEVLGEREANARIQNWLLGPGASLEIDFVTLRRALIDEGFWDREPGGSSYRRSRRHERRVRFADALPDELELLAAADDEAAERRRAFGAQHGA